MWDLNFQRQACAPGRSCEQGEPLNGHDTHDTPKLGFSRERVHENLKLERTDKRI